MSDKQKEKLGLDWMIVSGLITDEIKSVSDDETGEEVKALKDMLYKIDGILAKYGYVPF